MPQKKAGRLYATLLLRKSLSLHFVQTCKVYRSQRKSRTYAQCSQMFGCSLLPALMVEWPPGGKWILHTENGGQPHCVAFHMPQEYADSAEVTMWDSEGSFKLTALSVRTALAEGVDSSTCVWYAVNVPSEDTVSVGLPLLPGDVEKLLDMAAAAGHAEEHEMAHYVESDSEAEDKRDESSSSTHELAWLNDKGFVTVDRSLLEDLQNEVAGYIQNAAAGKVPKVKQGFRCPACPFRIFQKPSRVVHHLKQYHNEKSQYCCSGTKQLKIILAIHDSDMIQGGKRGNYLQRSAQLLRQQVKPSLSPTNNKVDSFVRLLLDSSGPRFVHHTALQSHIPARRVGNLWYTQSFAERLYQEILLHHSKAGGV